MFKKFTRAFVKKVQYQIGAHKLSSVILSLLTKSRRSAEVSSSSFLVLVLVSYTSSGNVFIFRFPLTPDNFCEFVSPSLLLLLSDARFSTRKFDRNFLRRENSSPKTIFCGVLFLESFSVMDDLTLSLVKSISFNFTLGSFCAWFSIETNLQTM